MKRIILREDLIGKVIKDTYLVDDEDSFCIVFEDDIYCLIGYVNDLDMGLQNIFLDNYDQKKIGLISEDEFNKRYSHLEAIRENNERKRYEELKAKYNLK